MEQQLTRIADAFESIAASLRSIQRDGLELYSNSDSPLRLSIDYMPLPSDFPGELSIALRNESYGTQTIPFEISQS